MKIRSSNGQTVKFAALHIGDVFRNEGSSVPLMKTEVVYSGMGNARNCLTFDGLANYTSPHAQVTLVEGVFVEGEK